MKDEEGGGRNRQSVGEVLLTEGRDKAPGEVVFIERNNGGSDRRMLIISSSNGRLGAGRIMAIVGVEPNIAIG